MSIPSSSRGEERESKVSVPLKIDILPNPEFVGISTESRFHNVLILCDRFSRMFRLLHIRDTISEACIDGLEQIISIISHLQINLPKIIVHIAKDFGCEFRSETYLKWCRENSIRSSTATPKHEE